MEARQGEEDAESRRSSNGSETGDPSKITCQSGYIFVSDSRLVFVEV